MKKDKISHLVFSLAFLGACIWFFNSCENNKAAWKNNVKLQDASVAQVRTCYVEDKITRMMTSTNEPVDGKAIEQLREMAKELFPDGKYYSGYKKPMQSALQVKGHKVVYADSHEAFYVKLGH